MAKKSRGARFRKTRGKVSPNAGKKKSSAPRSNSSLAKKNKGVAKKRVSRNQKQYKKDKQQYRTKKEKYAKKKTMEAQRFEREKAAINANKSLTPEQRRKELTTAQYNRRLREDILKRKEKNREQQFQAKKNQYQTAQQQEIEKYRRRKRAIEYTERQGVRSSPSVAIYNTPQQVQPAYGAYALQGQPVYGAYAAQPSYGGQSPMYGGQQSYDGQSSTYGGQTQQPPVDGDQQEQELPPIDDETAVQPPLPPIDVGVPQAAQSVPRGYPSSRVIVGVPEPRPEPIPEEIPALSELDPDAYRDFLLARQRYEQAVTVEDKIRYSIEFFDLAEKLDKMFHLHTMLWHRIMKYRPKRWSIQDAKGYADGLSKEQVTELAEYSPGDLENYLKTV